MKIVAMLIAAAMAAFVPAVACAAAELVVIESNAPTLSEGMVIDATRDFDLPAGAKVTLLTASGETVRLNGPFAGKAPVSTKPGGDPKLVDAVSRLLNPQGKDTSTLGAVRSLGGAGLADAEAINAATGGAFCTAADRPPRLRRAPNHAPEWAKLSDTKGADAGEVAWPAGVALADWPAAVPIADGGRYMLQRARSRPASIVLHLEPQGLSQGERLAWMAEHGCRDQAMALLDRMR